MSVVKKALLSAVVLVVSLALVEGLASLALLAKGIAVDARRPLAERRHTRFDAELGWVNVPLARVENLYGPGRHVTIDAHGFRSPRPDGDPYAPSPCRIVASGDSFTFGYGVGDDETWIEQLGGLAPPCDVVNMGQGGYGADQAYLWYRREADDIPHGLHLFAIIEDDIYRMRSDRFMGYGKPVLRVRGGRLRVEGVPVRRAGFRWPWLTQNQDLFASLRVATLLRGGGGIGAAPALGESETLSALLAAVTELHTLAARDGRIFAFVWLPRQMDYRDRPAGLRLAVLGELHQKGIAAVDLVEDLRRLSEPEVEGLFIQPGGRGEGGPRGVGHYSVAGNRFVAERLWLKLRLMGAVGRAPASTP